ncbi:hypothetical protein PENSPDRAFT_668653 [Peniophora sp. CONT]|nr:hypothetical protein PENSPDRAFT_668653 [Peniophora sp. CONT]
MSEGLILSLSSDHKRSAIEVLDVDSLREVFDWLAALYPARYNSLGWIVASHVCRSWRNIILDLPELWGGIILTFFHDPEARAEVLARARNAPLTIWPEIRPGDAYRPWSSRGLHLSREEISYIHFVVRPNVKRLAKLMVGEVADVTPYEWMEILPGQTLPYLHTLELSSSRKEDIQSRIRLPPFAAPQLRELVYLSTFYPFTTSSLRVFRFGSHGESSRMISIGTLYSCIQGCAQLETLELDWSLKIDTLETPFPDEVSLECPQLKTFRFMGVSSVFMGLWRLLRFKRLERLYLNLPLNDESATVCSFIQSVLRQREHDTFAIARRTYWPLEFFVGPRSVYRPWTAAIPTEAEAMKGVIVTFNEFGPGARPHETSPRQCIAAMAQAVAQESITRLDLTDDWRHFVNGGVDVEQWDIPDILGTSLVHVQTLVLPPNPAILIRILDALVTQRDIFPRVDSFAFKHVHQAYSGNFNSFVNRDLPTWLTWPAGSREKLLALTTSRQRNTHIVRFVDPILSDDASLELREHMSQFMATVVANSVQDHSGQ